MNATERCCDSLRAATGLSYAVLGGRANTLWAAYLNTINANGKAVIFPSIMCLSPVMTAQCAGAVPVFCDVKLSDATLSPESLDILLNMLKGKIAVVFAVDIYGNRCAIDDIDAVCCKYQVPVIEDAAQAFGVPQMGRHAQGCLLSFGHTKQIDCGLGGAFLTNDESVAERMRGQLREVKSINKDQLTRLSENYRRVYYALEELDSIAGEAGRFFSAMFHCYSDLLFRNAAEADWERIADLIEKFPSELLLRRNLVETYEHLLSGKYGATSLMHDVKESSPWRFSFMVPKERRAALIASLRAKGIDASSWYPAIHRWFSKEKSPAGCPNADVVAQQVVNLWVDKKDPNYAERVAAMVVENLARPEEGPSG